MRIVIIEDEPLMAHDLAADIVALRPDWEVVASLGSVKQATDWLRRHGGMDLIFSDIQLGDGTCFDVFSATPPPAPVIFCTAYDQYAIQAFQTNGIGYLLKPYSLEHLRAAIEKYERLRPPVPSIDVLFQALQSHQQQPIQQPSLLQDGTPQPFDKQSETPSALDTHLPKHKQQLETPSAPDAHPLTSKQQPETPPAPITKLLVHHKDKILPIPIADVALFFLHHENTMLLRFDGQRFPIQQSLGEIEALVGTQFYRASRQHLINRSAIQSATQYFARKLLLHLSVPFEEQVTISKEKAGGFLEWLSR